MTDIEKVEAEIKVLEKKLVLLEEIEKYKNQTLYDLIVDWWGSAETQNKDPIISDLVNRIEKWLPKEQSAQGSQNHYVECTVEGFNDCLTDIKGKLR